MTCSACGAPDRTGAFCGRCGVRLAAAAPAARPSLPPARAVATASLAFLATLLALAVLLALASLALRPPRSPGELEGRVEITVAILYVLDAIAALVAGRVAARLLRPHAASSSVVAVVTCLAVLVPTGAAIVMSALRDETTAAAAAVAVAVVVAGAATGAVLPGRRPRPPRPVTAATALPFLVVMVLLASGMPARATTQATPATSPHLRSCVVSARAAFVKSSVTVFGLSVGRPYAYEQEQRGDGRWSVTVKRAGTVGLKAAVGGRLGVLSSALSLNLDAEAQRADTYDVDDRDEADDLVFARARLDAAPLTGAAGLLYRSVEEVKARALRSTVLSVPPQPAREDFRIKGTVGAGIAFGGVGASASVGAGIGASVARFAGERHDERRVDTYFVVRGQAGAEMASMLNGDLGGDATLKVSWAKKEGASDLTYRPVGLSVSAGVSLAAGSGLDLRAPLIPQVKASGSAKGSGRLHVGGSLDLRDVDNLAAATAFAAALAGSDPERPSPALRDAARGLVDRFLREATMHAATYSTAGVGTGFDILLGSLVAFGLSAENQFSEQRLHQAAYRVPGGQLLPWAECHGAAANGGAMHVVQ